MSTELPRLPGGAPVRNVLLAAMVILVLFVPSSSIVSPCAARSTSVAAHGSPLVAYFQTSHPAWEVASVYRATGEIFRNASAAERAEASTEVLAYFHVVYHTTATHHIEANVALTRRYARVIRVACRQFRVPLPVALAILTWENGGRISATSYAACTGVGQLSMGAVRTAHQYAARVRSRALWAVHFFVLLRGGVEALCGAGNLPVRRLDVVCARLRRKARIYDLAARHARMAHARGVSDERMVARANIEDSVVFMRYLLDMYGGRADLAISAYHNGVGNTDDLLAAYLCRFDAKGATFTTRRRDPLLAALTRDHIDYLTLWNDRRSREMLNGLRTMDGVPTTPANASQALGDEADIYLWKTIGALVAVQVSPFELQDITSRYVGTYGQSETVGFDPATDLVPVSGNVKVTRELVGYVASLDRRLRAHTGHGLHVSMWFGTTLHDTASHRDGLAVDFALNQPGLEALIRRDWLFDRIFCRRLPGGRLHVCLNPRFGNLFLASYERERGAVGSTDRIGGPGG